MLTVGALVCLSHNFYGGAPSTHIEMTGYGLLAMVTGGRTGDAFPVAR